MEALNNAALILVDRSTAPGNIFNKGNSGTIKADGLVGAVLETRDMHLSSAVLSAIDLAEYVISGPQPEEGTPVRVDESGMYVGERA